MSEVINLYNETTLLSNLIQDTFALIGRTRSIEAVKLLVEIYDILKLNADLLDKYKESKLTFDEVWVNTSTLKQLNYLRCKLMVCYYPEFTSLQELKLYNKSFCSFYNLILLRLKNGFDVEMKTIS